MMRKERPTRATIILASMFLSLLGGAGYVIVQHRYRDTLAEAVNTFRSKKVRG